MQPIAPLNQAPRRGLIERILPITLRSALCVATAIALLTARSSAAWAEVEDVGTPGPAILDDASGSSGITNKADALRFDDARFAFSDPSVGSTFLSVGGRFVPIVGADLEPSREGQVDPGRPATAFDYNLSGDYSSGAPDAIPATVKDFGAVDEIIQNDFMLNGAGDSFVTDPVGGLGYWTTIDGSSPLDFPVNPMRVHASCSSDGSSSTVKQCQFLALGLPDGAETGSSGSYSPGLGAPPLPQGTVGATLLMPPVYFSVANEVTLPVLNTASTPLLDFVIPDVNSNYGQIVDLTAAGIGDITQSAPTPSIPELPAPTMIVIGLGGIALARRFRLRSATRLV
jgi:hypothetical protein